MVEGCAKTGCHRQHLKGACTRLHEALQDLCQHQTFVITVQDSVMSQQSHKNKGLFRSSSRNIESSYYQTEMFLLFFFGGKLHNMLMLNWHQSKHFALMFLPNLWLFQRKHCTLMLSVTCWWLFFKKKYKSGIVTSDASFHRQIYTHFFFFFLNTLILISSVCV